jgi:hypothetical protein
MLSSYYEHQDEMNHWARILQSPESIGKVWEEEQLSRKEKARAVLSVHEESLRPEDKQISVHEQSLRPDDRGE